MLIESKANANLKNNFGRSPIEDALQAGHSEIAEALAAVSKLDDDKVYSSYDPKQYDEKASAMFPVEEED